ncbi:hypothetical protein ACFQH9_02195 [Pseudonocardia lutea]|uniref:Uncharacterized protein n=1 Tax=Pseudonocardia lutea TaxID=2172015 RepID=A0ABW1I2Q8_9PSEU
MESEHERFERLREELQDMGLELRRAEGYEVRTGPIGWLRYDSLDHIDAFLP